MAVVHPQEIYQLPRGRPDLLIQEIRKQPVAIMVDAASPSFQQYNGEGVITGDDCGDEPNHAVLAVGYGHEGD